MNSNFDLGDIREIESFLTTESNALKVYSVFSSLFTRHYMGFDESTTPPADSRYMQYRRDMEDLSKSWKESLLEEAAKSISAMATIYRFGASQYILNSALTWMGVDPTIAYYTASNGSAFLASVQWFLEHNVQIDSTKDYLNTASVSHLIDLTPIRKISKVVASLNGALFALPWLVTGIKAFSSLNMYLQVPILVSGAIADYNSYSDYFSKQYGDLITGFATFKMDNLSTARKRSWLAYFADRAYEYVDHRFDEETMAIIYNSVFKG
jgi:hypothetical protein